MADTLKNKLAPVQPVDVEGTELPNKAPPKDRTVAEIIQKQNDLLNDPQFQQEAPPELRKQVEESRKKAFELYQDRASKAEWAEVAQTIAGALVQYGAAKMGQRSGRDMSGISTPNIDYQRRIERYGKDYERQSGMADSDASLARQEWADKELARRQSLGEALKANELELKPAEQREKDAADLLQRQAQDKSALDRVLTEAGFRSSESTKKQQFEAGESELDRASREKIARMGTERTLNYNIQRDNEQKQREDSKEVQQEIKSLEQQMKQGQAELKKRQALVNDLGREGDLSGKARKKLEPTYGRTAGEAGVDLSVVDEARAAAQSDRSILGIPLGKKTDEKKYKEELKSRIVDTKAQELLDLSDRITALKQKRAGVSSQSQPVGSSPASSKPAAPQASGGKVRVQYQGRVMQIDAADLPAAIKDGAVKL